MPDNPEDSHPPTPDVPVPPSDHTYRPLPYPSVVRARGSKPDPSPSWLRDLMLDLTEARLAEERVERAKRKRALALFAAHEFHGASYRWLAARVGVDHSRIVQLVRDGKRIAEAGGLTEEMLRLEDRSSTSPASTPSATGMPATPPTPAPTD